MKKNYFFTLQVWSFFFLTCVVLYSCNTRNKHHPIGKQDTTLKNLIVMQGESEIYNTASSVPMNVEVTLKQAVDAQHPLKIVANPNYEKAEVFFDNDKEAMREKKFSSFKDTIQIKVSVLNNTTLYTLKLIQSESNNTTKALLKKLVIKQGSETLKELEKPVPEKVYATLKTAINAGQSLIVEARGAEDGDKVFFDGEKESKNEKTYTSFQSKISLEVHSGIAKTTYIIELKKAKIPEPKNYSVKCNVIDSFAGSNVEEVKIDVFERGKPDILRTSSTNSDGNAYFTLDGDKFYDFLLSKKGMAASRLENVHVKQNTKTFVPIVMREWAVGSMRIAPEIAKLEVKEGTSFLDITEPCELDMANATNEKTLKVTVKSKSGEIIPYKLSDLKNYGFLANLDSPTSLKSSSVILPILQEENNKKVTIDSDGTVTQVFSLDLHKLTGSNGEHVLYLILYDVAGNRLERRVRINIKNSILKDMADSRASFNSFEAKSERYYRSIHTFGMPREAGASTSLFVEFKFKLAPSNTTIKSVDVLRRPYQKDDITSNWAVVSRRNSQEGFSGDKGGSVIIYDDSLSVEEGQTYQYKLHVYTQNGKLESHVATLRMMEAFSLSLTSPEHREIIKKSAVQDLNFSFSLSNDSLWSKEKADYFLFDMLIVKDMTSSSGIRQEDGICFASKMKYDLAATGNDVLSVASPAISKDRIIYRKYKKVGAKSHSIDKLIAYKNGTITVQRMFFAEPKFNFARIPLREALETPGMYYWDIENFGADPLAHVYAGTVDESGASFVKEYPYLDAMTGAQIQGKARCLSSSYCNLNRFGGALNGRACLLIK